MNTLSDIENQKQNEQQDFWLLQYQKLLDSQPMELSQKSSSIDPLLGYNFLLNGVVHCLPFLSKIWQSKQTALEDITNEDLEAAGVKKETDRAAILQSIRDYLKVDIVRLPSATAPTTKKQQVHELVNEIAESEEQQPSTSDGGPLIGETLAECVVCMEKSVCIVILENNLIFFLFCFLFL